MEDTEYIAMTEAINAAVSAYLEEGGDPSAASEFLEELAEYICE